MTIALDNIKDTVLIVEDTAANYEVTQTFLNDIDVKCENAFDGMEAITLCSSVGRDYYSLILMDINLPYMNGVEVARKLREMGIRTPIIATTAANKDAASLKNADKVFDSILFKPFNYLEFYASIATYIKNAGAYIPELKNISGEEQAIPVVDVKICDIHQAISNMGNNPRLFIKHFNNFKNNNMDLGPRLLNLIEGSQYSEAAILCHSIKGLSGMLGLTDLYAHIIELENCLAKFIDSNKKPDKLIKSLLFAVGNDIRLVCQIQF